MEYSYTPLYYNAPTQVRYWENNRYYGGIGYHDILIKGETGEVAPIQSIIDNAEKQGIHWDSAIIELDWIHLDEAIMWGDRYWQTSNE